MNSAAGADVVFLIDVDNTLLDNDRIHDDLAVHLETEFGASGRERYWAMYEALRDELGFADLLGALQRFRCGTAPAACNDPALLQMSSFLLDYPFADRLYPDALAVLARLGGHGRTVILSDGDAVLQPRKIQRSGLWDAVDGRVLVYIHKEWMLDDVVRRHPASRYVMVDDKLRVLSAMKRAMELPLTTVFVRQGHYALDPQNLSAYPRADISIGRIGELPAALDEAFSASCFA